jgi:AraC family cel operon transcriptional repressor
MKTYSVSHLADYVPKGRSYHVARYTRLSTTRPMPHAHDFAELFWLERGRMVHQVNGITQRLSAGDLILIAANDRHTFRSQARHAITFVNVAFDAATLADLQKRYRKSLKLSWRQGREGHIVSLTDDELSRLKRWADRLSAGPNDRLMLEAFLIDILAMLRDHATRRPSPHVPTWLSEAMTEFRHGQNLAAGVAGLAELAGRSPEHLTRTIRQLFGCTAWQWINDARLDYAAARLTMSDDDVLTIAWACGFANLSGFYRRFNERFGTTPAKYRRRQRQLVG